MALGFRMRSETTKEPTAAIIGINMMAVLFLVYSKEKMGLEEDYVLGEGEGVMVA